MNRDLNALYGIVDKLTCHKCAVPDGTVIATGSSLSMIYDDSIILTPKESCGEMPIANCQIVYKKSEFVRCMACFPGFSFLNYQCVDLNCETPSAIPGKYICFFVFSLG